MNEEATAQITYRWGAPARGAAFSPRRRLLEQPAFAAAGQPGKHSSARHATVSAAGNHSHHWRRPLLCSRRAQTARPGGPPAPRRLRQSHPLTATRQRSRRRRPGLRFRTCFFRSNSASSSLCRSTSICAVLLSSNLSPPPAQMRRRAGVQKENTCGGHQLQLQW